MYSNQTFLHPNLNGYGDTNEITFKIRVMLYIDYQTHENEDKHVVSIFLTPGINWPAHGFILLLA